MSNKMLVVLSIALPVALGGCVNENSRILSADSQVELRQIQSRSYETKDKALVMRAVLSTLQDLGFIVDKADETIGTISASQLKGDSTVKMTVSVRTTGKQTIVRANAQMGLEAISDPAPYQNFFNSLSQSLFLAENSVD